MIAQYNLPSDFDIDGYENLVPAHLSCNQRKSDTLVDRSPAFSLHLMQVRLMSGLAKAIAEKIEQDRKKAPLIAKLESAIAEGDITEAELRELLSGLPVIIRKSFDDGGDEHIFIAPGWEIIELKGGRDIALVRTPNGIGITSLAPNAHYSWTCPTCGNRGPWDGVICRSCGRRHMPDD